MGRTAPGPASDADRFSGEQTTRVCYVERNGALGGRTANKPLPIFLRQHLESNVVSVHGYFVPFSMGSSKVDNPIWNWLLVTTESTPPTPHKSSLGDN